jgi:hypothetical protein
LSPFFRQQRDDLLDPDTPPLDQTEDHAHMTHDRRRGLARRFRGAIHARLGAAQVAFAVLMTLLLRVFAVEGRGAPGAAPAPMRLPAPELAAQIVATGVTRIGEEENPAMPTALQVGPQIGPLAQQRPNLGIVRPNQIARLAPAMPIRLELEMLLDFACYKPRR